MNRKQGFTLVEIMIVVLIIGLLAAIAVPNFAKARAKAQANACIDNMRQIEAACEQLKMEGDTSPTSGDIYGADKYIKTEPSCPAQKGSKYDIPTGDERPTCPNEIESHVLPVEGGEEAEGDSES